MDSKDLILAIDNGTQSLKALIFNGQGDLLAKAQVPFKPYFSEQPGWAEQDPALFWQALCTGCQTLWQQFPGYKDRLRGVALTTQRGTVVNVDRNGRPLRPAMLWLDQRKAYGLPSLKGFWGMLFQMTGLAETVTYLQQEAEANWIATYQPEIWKQTHKYLLLSGYLTYRLTGRYADSVGCQVGYIPFDYKKQDWASRFNWKWKVLPVMPEMLPDLVMPGSVIGEVTSTAAEETGIPARLPLVAAAADKACEVIGSGSLSPDIGCLSYGTTATINVTQSRYVAPVPLLPAYPSAVPGKYSVEVQVFRGFWMINWFKEEFGHPERETAAETGLDAEILFEQLLKDIPPCSMGLVLQPYWTPGLKMPGPEAKGAVIGFGDVHSRAHLYRSILEGLAYALREGKERIEKRGRTPITSLRVSGGGSQSQNAMQITADVFGIPTARPHVYETSGLGAAIDVAAGLGLHPDFDSCVAAMTHVKDVFQPNPKYHAMYDALYHDVYKKMYKRLKPLYKRIREITGYPR